MNNIKSIRAVEIYTSDRYLFQKVRLLAPEGVTVTLGAGGGAFPIRLVDIDTAELPDGEFITMSRTQSDADVKIPFPIDFVAELLSGKGDTAGELTLSDSERSVYLYGEKIKLTEVEYLLLSTLTDKKGDYVSREDILERVWGGDADPGVINVYIHYLREKLEKGGEKIILSSRKCGYKISERYVGKDA